MAEIGEGGAAPDRSSGGLRAGLRRLGTAVGGFVLWCLFLVVALLIAMSVWMLVGSDEAAGQPLGAAGIIGLGCLGLLALLAAPPVFRPLRRVLTRRGFPVWRVWFAALPVLLVAGMIGVTQAFAPMIEQYARSPEGQREAAQAREAEWRESEHRRISRDAAAAAADTEARIERKVRAERCVGAWTGRSGRFVDAVKERLRNPRSFEHIATAVGSGPDGEPQLTMQFRAENGFGGMNIETATARVDPSTCEVTQVEMQGD